MGIRYKGGSSSYRSIGENLGNAIREEGIPYHDGYFGSAGHGNNVREVYVDDVYRKAKEFYGKIAYGGIEDIDFTRDKNNIMFQTKMRDGTIITYREVTSSNGSPAVQISVRQSNDSHGLKNQKIHFVKKRKK